MSSVRVFSYIIRTSTCVIGCPWCIYVETKPEMSSLKYFIYKCWIYFQPLDFQRIYFPCLHLNQDHYVDRVKRIWYLSPMRAAKVQASLCIRAVSPEPSLLAHTSSESRGTFRQKARSVAPLNGWACAVEICHDGMLEDTNSLDRAYVQMEVEV